MSFSPIPGTVYIVGAGPGAPDLITVRGQAIIAEADLILYADSLVEEEVALLARKPSAQITATSTLSLDQIVPLMVEAATAGQVVARIHSGDPALYGATHEQMLALRRAGIPYQIVPGVPAAFAAAARLGVELTVPELAQTIILTRAAGRVAMPEGEDLRGLAAHGTSLAILLSVTRMRQVVAELLAGGRYTPQTPVAVLHRVSWPDESLVSGTLADIAEKVRAAGYTRQAIIMVGPALAALDNLHAEQPVSHLYSSSYTHRFRRATAKPLTPNPSPARGEGVARSAGGEGQDDLARSAGGEGQDDLARSAGGEGQDDLARSAGGEGQSATVVISLTLHGSRTAATIAAGLGAELLPPAKFAPEGQPAYHGSVLEEIRRQWPQRSALVLVLASGIAVRAIAPLLGAKGSDPAVICVDEAGRSVIPLLGGHQASANALAQQIAALTGGHAALTTASDIQGLPALDQLGRAEGWKIDPASALTHSMACLVNGEPIGLYIDPALANIRAQAESWLAQAEQLTLVDDPTDLLRDDYRAGLLISYRELGETGVALQHKAVYYQPPVLVAGLGCRRGVPAAELRAALNATLAEAGLDPACLAALATVDLKADEPGLRELAAELGLPLKIITREQLANLNPAGLSPSAATAKFDLPGVAEPCALLAAGGPLIQPKRAFERCTVAIALVQGGAGTGGQGDRGIGGQLVLTAGAKYESPLVPLSASEASALSPCPSATTHLALIGIGPGDPAQMTIAAREALRAAAIVTGYHVYIEQVRHLLRPEQELIVTPAMGNEMGRARQAVELAASGHSVALISSGDIGIYAMAGPIFEVLRERGWRPGDAPTVEVLPGVSAFQAVAARLGAPLTHDFCCISLSDLLTPWELIVRRVAAAAAADFVIAFYNPRSRERHWQLGQALDILRAQRDPATPVAIARNATRPDEQITLTTLAEIDPSGVDMFTLVLVGNSQSFALGERMATPRGYAAKGGEPGAAGQGDKETRRQGDKPPDELRPPGLPVSQSPGLPVFSTQPYPITLSDLRGALAVVVGGGPVGERKVRGLLATGAAIRLISPEASVQLQEWAAAGLISWERRPYVAGDLAGARLAFAATSLRAVNALVAAEATAGGLLCNVADAPHEGSFHLPAVHRSAEALVAVSTGGTAPAQAVALRDAIAGWLASDIPAPSINTFQGRSAEIVTTKSTESAKSYRRRGGDNKLRALRVLRGGTKSLARSTAEVADER